MLRTIPARTYRTHCTLYSPLDCFSVPNSPLRRSLPTQDSSATIGVVCQSSSPRQRDLGTSEANLHWIIMVLFSMACVKTRTYKHQRRLVRRSPTKLRRQCPEFC